MNGDDEKGNEKILTNLLHFSFSFQEANRMLCIKVLWEDGKVQVSWEVNEEASICVAHWGKPSGAQQFEMGSK